MQNAVDQYWLEREQNLDIMLLDNNGLVLGPFFDGNLDYSGISLLSDEKRIFKRLLTNKVTLIIYLAYTRCNQSQTSQVLLHLYPFIIIVSLIIGDRRLLL